MEDKYVSTTKAKEILGVHTLTLHNWEKAGKIETIRTGGGHRLYNIEKYLKDNQKNNVNSQKNTTNIIAPITAGSKDPKEGSTKAVKENVCYVRATSISNKQFLKKEKTYMQTKYPDYTIIEDIGSSLSFNKNGFKKIINLAVEGKLGKLVMTDNINLATYEYDMLEYMIKTYSNGSIVLEVQQKDSNSKKNIIDDVTQTLEVCITKLSNLKGDV